jgi:hypothetical protein
MPGAVALPIGIWQAGQTFLLYDDGTQFILLTKEPMSAIVAACRNLQIQSVSTTTATVTADEVILKATGTGLPLLVQSASVTIDITTGVALNGFETAGARATSHWYYIWLISNGTTVKAVLDDAGAGDGAAPGSGPDLTGGAFSGYTYIGLVGQLRLNATGSGEITRFYQRDRRVFMEETNCLNTTANGASATYVVLAGGDATNFRTVVPPNAVYCHGIIGTNETGSSSFCSIAACDSAGAAITSGAIIGACHIVAASAGSTYESFAACGYFEVPVRGGAAARNIQWKASAATVDTRIQINGYTF